MALPVRILGVVQVFFLLSAFSPASLSQSAAGKDSPGVASAVKSQKSQPVNSSPAEEPSALQQSQPEASDSSNTVEDDSGQEMGVKVPEGEALLRARISVPNYMRPVSTLTFYPYPTRIPKQIRTNRKIDDKEKSVKGMLMSLGYASRSSETKLFPTNGYRWQFILRAACQKAGTRPPTNIITMYPWIHKMIPYVQEQIERVNEIEAERQVRYLAAVKDFEENGLDLENLAMQKGLAPIEIPMKLHARKLLNGSAVVAPGTWYVVATHKTANLKFFWQIPVTVSAGESKLVELTQTNALVIEGSW